MFFRILAIAVFSLFVGVLGQPALAQEAASDSKELAQAKDALVKVLQDPKGREALIQMLQEQPASGSAAAASVSQEETGTVATQIGLYVQGFAGSLYEFGQLVVRGLSGYSSFLSGESEIDTERLLEGIYSILRVLVPAYLVLMVLHRIALSYTSRFVEASKRYRFTRKLGFLLATSAADAVFVVIGAGVGYLFAYIFSSSSTEQAINYIELFSVNAFFMIEIARVVIRFVFAPHRKTLRLLPFSDDEAVYWARRLIFVVGLLGFGVRLAVPVVSVNLSVELGSSVRVTVVLVTIVYMLMIIMSSRVRVREAIIAYGRSFRDANFTRQIFHVLAHLWHLIALAYVLAVMVAWIRSPLSAIETIADASGRSLLIIFVGLWFIMMFSRIMRRGIDLPKLFENALPTLENRLNSFLPRVCMVLRSLTVLAVIVGVLEVWGVGSIFYWLWEGAGVALRNALISALIVVLVGFLLWLSFMSWIDMRLHEQEGLVVSSRTRTLYKLFSNAVSILILVMFTLLALSELGVEIGPLIAGAGVVGLAVSFGSQKLVQDVITGAFIQLENAMNEGDFVELGGISGTVEQLSLRSVRLRDLAGTSHVIPFSSVSSVSNSTKDYGYAVAVIGVSYDTDIKEAKDAMVEAFQRLVATPDSASIIGDLEMHGITAFGDSAINIRARIKTSPGNQWAIGRAYNEHIKSVFDEREIDIPFPQVTYHVASDAPSAAPPQAKLSSAEAQEPGTDSGTASSSSKSDDRAAPDSDGDK